jgi:superfamily II DNA or RNA helicase
VSASWKSLLGNDAIISMVGHEAFARAMVAVRDGHVHDVELDAERLEISGRVKGTYRDDYVVRVFLAASRSGTVTAYRSQCSCPVAVDCKHAAAVLVVARHLAAAEQRVARPEWEKTLDRLLAAETTQADADVSPLALEFGIEQIPAFRGYVGRQDLRIRPARQGRQGWVRSGISWEDLDYVARSYVPEHRELLLQFRAAAGATARYAMPRNPWLSLSTVGTGFWGLLEQAEAVGLTIIAAQPILGPTRSEVTASIGVDISRGPAGQLELRPRVTLGDHELPLTELGVLGDPAHGVFHVGPETDGVRPLLVARLDGALTRELRQLVVNAQSIEVPPADEERLRADFLPRLRRAVTVTTRDAAVRLPKLVEPAIGLTVQFHPEHQIELQWSVHYDEDGAARAFPVNQLVRGQELRDLVAERRLLAALPLPDGPPTGAATRLSGHAAWAFVDQTLPKLEAAGVRVTLAGQVIDYRESLADPAVAVAAVPRPGSDDWFDLNITVSVDGESVPFEPLFVALTEGQDFLILESGVYFSLDRAEFGQLSALIEESRAIHDHQHRELTLNRYELSVWDDVVDLGVAIDQTVEWSRSVRGLDGVTSVEPVEVPSSLQAELRPYQVDGFRWLAFLWTHRLGGILADDMGLGKTLQALALIAYAQQTRPGPPFLVIAPTSVVSNWSAEARKFVPGLKVVTLPESQAKRGRAIAEVVAGADVVVTSYALLRLDNDALAAQPWSGLILDEAQFVKNHRAKTYQAARRISAPFRLAITGTPMENSLMDLWALLSITAPGLFPHADRFAEYYRRPIERQHDTVRLRQLQRRVRPLMLRRTKEHVAPDLPPKQELVVQVELHPRHQRIYQTHLQRERQKVLGLIEDLERNRFTILRSLTLLRRLSLDPALLDPQHEGVPAAKVDLLLAELTELVTEGHQALVFSQFTTFLGRIRSRLTEAGIAHAYLDGSTRNREEVVERFRSGDASVFLISLKAGGFGLNLTEADYCFVLDPWWNPAAEAQAVDRTHRIGQTRPVMVYRLVAKDTIEEKVMELKARKSALFDAVVGDEALSVGTLSAEEIRSLIGP